MTNPKATHNLLRLVRNLRTGNVASTRLAVELAAVKAARKAREDAALATELVPAPGLVPATPAPDTPEA